MVQNAQGPNTWEPVGIYAGDGMVYSALNPAVGTLPHPIVSKSDTVELPQTRMRPGAGLVCPAGLELGIGDAHRANPTDRAGVRRVVPGDGGERG